MGPMPSESTKLSWIIPAVVAALLTLAGVAVLSSIGGSGGRAPTPTASSPSPPKPSASPSDHKLYNLEFAFCLDTDKVTTLEAPLVSGAIKPAKAASLVQQAQFIAQHQADAFSRAGFDALARQIQDWADAFGRTRSAVLGGADPVKSIHPPVKALSAIERTIDCEGDA